MNKLKLALPTLFCVFMFLSDNTSGSESFATKTDVQKTARVGVLGGKATIVPPKGFKKLPAEEKNHFSSLMPYQIDDVIYADTEGGKASILFSVISVPEGLKDEYMPQLTEYMAVKYMGDLKPKLTTRKINGHTVSRIESIMSDPAGKEHVVVTQFSLCNDKLLFVLMQIPLTMKDKYLSEGIASLDTLTY